LSAVVLVDLGGLARSVGAGYLNGVAVVATRLGPAETLAALHRIEARFGRARARLNAPRTLDLDLIAHGRTMTVDRLVVPHPRAHERLFVMGPLAEIAPEWTHPTSSGETATRLARDGQCRSRRVVPKLRLASLVAVTMIPPNH
jgi:7,8-dihydro-6-hydroxymethylpterin-pyrophosphokinase